MYASLRSLNKKLSEFIYISPDGNYRSAGEDASQRGISQTAIHHAQPI